MSPRILVNALALRPQGSGVQTYITNLLPHLAGHGLDLHALVQQDVAAGLPAGVTPLVLPSMSGVRRAVHGLRPRRGADLVHALNVALPVTGGTPKVVTVHDLVQFDLPGALSPAKAAALRLHLRVALERADAIIAVSAFTASRIREVFGRLAVAIPLAPGPAFVPPTEQDRQDVRRRHLLPERFVLHVGTIGPRKDLPTLVEACRRTDVPLVLVGAGAMTTGPGVSHLGWVPDGELPALYGAATVVAYPSRYEGFGLPPLEALACGAPVIASDLPPLRATLGDAAVLFPPGDVDALRTSLATLLDDDARRHELALAGPRQAASFTWSQAAEQTLGVYRSLGLDL